MNNTICAGCKSLDTTPTQLRLCGCQCHDHPLVSAAAIDGRMAAQNVKSGNAPESAAWARNAARNAMTALWNLGQNEALRLKGYNFTTRLS